MSQSCDDKAPPGVDTHGGSRTCTNGVCGRETAYCSSMPSLSDLDTVDNYGNLSSLGASYLEFDRVFSPASGLTTCHGWMSSNEDVPWRSATEEDYNGNVACIGLCNNPTNAEVITGVATAPALTYFDSNPVNSATTIRFDVHGRTVAAPTCLATQTAALTLTINGIAIASKPASTTSCSNICAKAGFCQRVGVVQILVPTGIPACPAGANPCWNYGSSNSIVVSNTRAGVTVDLADVTVNLTTTQRTNSIHQITPAATVQHAYNVSVHPGFLHGAYPTQTGGTTAVVATYTSIIDNAAGGNQRNPAILDLRDPTNVMPLPQITQPVVGQCVGTCPFAITEFNFGPSPPAGDGMQVFQVGGAGPGQLYYANYTGQGDVVQVTSTTGSTFTATKIGTNSSGAAADWTSIMDMTPSANTKSDKLLRMAHAATIDFFDPDPKNRGFRYLLFLNSKNGPNSIVGPPKAGGVGPFWYAAGMQYIEAVTGMAADPLNQTNNTFAEVRENRPAVAGACNGIYTYTVLIHGSDHTVRPLADYTDVNCNVIQGVYSVLGLPTATYVPPTFNTVAAGTTNEGRITAGTVSNWHRIVPPDPTVGGVATFTTGLLPP
jgi:hypothetical protein